MTDEGTTFDDVLAAAAAAGASGPPDTELPSEEIELPPPEPGPPEFEFGSDADSSSWSSEEEEATAEPLAAGSLPAWLASRREAVSDEDDEPAAAAPLPPVEPAPAALPLLPDEDIQLAGVVLSVVGSTVVVQAHSGSALLDDGSTLCLADRRPFGAVEETFGPVTAPLYAVRRCQPTCGEPLLLEEGTSVFFVLGRSVLIEDIDKLRVKGYDASGKDDEELAEDQDYSDDEKEAEARAARKASRPRAEAAPESDATAGFVLPGARPAAPARPRQRGRPAPHQQHPAAAGMPAGFQQLQGAPGMPLWAPGWPPPGAWGMAAPLNGLGYPQHAMIPPGAWPPQAPFPGAWGGWGAAAYPPPWGFPLGPAHGPPAPGPS